MANVKQRFVNHWTWYYSFGGIFLALAAIYIVLHIFFAGEERLAFSKEDITNIQTIINAINARDKSDSLFPCIIRHDRPKIEGSDITKGGQKKQDGNSGKPQDKKGNGIVKMRGCELCPPQNHSDSILYSIDGYIRAKYPVKDTCDYLSFMVQFQMVDFNITFLTGYNLRVDSYFWLTENKVFLEIIFWTLFGLLSNLFYHVSEAFRTNTYNKTEAYVHWAKLIYSPVISIVIYFSIEALIADGQASLNNLKVWIDCAIVHPGIFLRPDHRLAQSPQGYHPATRKR